jgi:dienelactone hydrolase
VNESIEWTGPDVAHDGVVEREFRLSRAEGVVPGVLWRPPVPDPESKQKPKQKPKQKLVLLGHGGSGHKRSDRIVALACWFASQAGLAALAIDGPYHGDRVSAPMPAAEYQRRIVAEGTDAVLDRMTGDWLAAVDALGADGIADPESVGYLGMSMATRFGLPLAAALGDRLRCVALGKFGLRQGQAMPEGLARPERAAADARRITAPTLFHLQWHDEVFPRDGQLALFELFGSPDKELVGYAGPHAETKPQAVARWRDFIAGHLTSDDAGDQAEPGSVRDQSL